MLELLAAGEHTVVVGCRSESAAAELSKMMSGAEVAAAAAAEAAASQQSWLAQKMAFPLPRESAAPVRPFLAAPRAASKKAACPRIAVSGAAWRQVGGQRRCRPAGPCGRYRP